MSCGPPDGQRDDSRHDRTLADAAQAIAALRPRNAHTKRVILSLLGFPSESFRRRKVEKPTTVVSTPTKASTRAQPAEELSATSPSSATAVHAAKPISVGSIQSSEPEAAVVLIPDPTKRAPRSAPDWLARSPTLREPSTATPTVPAPAPPSLVPLFVPEWSRGILSGSLSTIQYDGAIDVERIVRVVSRGTPLVEVPREPRPTMARGVQVLVDRSDAMLPYAADEEWLLGQIRAVAGEWNVEVLRFDGCPSWGAGPGAKWTWVEYHDHHTPHAGAVVLLLTDVGIGAPPSGNRRAPSQQDWVDFATRLKRAGCHAIAFVPYAPKRWPSQLRRVMQLLHWDRRTSARTVRQLIGQGLGTRVRGVG